MKNSILGTIAGLLVGSVGALAYSHFAGDGSLLATLEAQLNDANAKLAQSQSAQRFLKEQNNSSSQQVDQLVASNDALKKQLAGQADGSAPSPTTTSPTTVFDPNLIRAIMGMMRGGGPGGFRSPEQRMFLLQNRLKLDPEQAKAIRAAMDADEQARREAFRQARQNGTRPDPAALAAASTLDKTLQSVLTPQQQAQYQQVQDDERAARAETNATAQVDNVLPLLQISDDQKEKMVNALYQQQLAAQDPMSLAGNPNAIQLLTQQGQAMQAAMKQVLTPEQYSLYQQSEQLQQHAFANFGGGRRSNYNDVPGGGPNGGNGPGGGPGGGPAAGGQPVTPPAVTTTLSGTTTTPTGTSTTTASTGTDTTTTSSTSTTTSTGTATPGATTNADASATPPTSAAN